LRAFFFHVRVSGDSPMPFFFGATFSNSFKFHTVTLKISKIVMSRELFEKKFFFFFFFLFCDFFLPLPNTNLEEPLSSHPQTFHVSSTFLLFFCFSFFFHSKVTLNVGVVFRWWATELLSNTYIRFYFESATRTLPQASNSLALIASLARIAPSSASACCASYCSDATTSRQLDAASG
jgi:hypothetical protein